MQTIKAHLLQLTPSNILVQIKANPYKYAFYTLGGLLCSLLIAEIVYIYTGVWI